MDITQAIKEKALSVGFDHVGICSASPLEKEAQFLQEWLKQGYAAGMHYMQASFDKRINPALSMPEAKSIICLALHYSPVKQDAPLKIASYAHVKDYHETMKPLLAELESFIDGIAGRTVNKLSFIDSGPLMEKAYAQKAGIGFQGKNTNLIHPHKGSFFFLAEILLDMELEYDTPLEISCGTCNRCIENCPTGALIQPYVLDANKCISWLTIENKEGIPLSIRKKLGNWIFGCDICQTVCPFNRKTAVIEPDGAMPEIKLQKLKAIATERKFKEIFQEWPVMRAKKKGLIRNILIAYGNSKQTAEKLHIEALTQLPEADYLKEHAQWAMDCLNSKGDI
jgi:epoxyqueuosine reductase